MSSDSAALVINAFSLDGIGPAIHLGGYGAGTFSYGIEINAIKSTGTAFFVDGNAPPMASAINLTVGSFSTAAEILGNGLDTPTLLVRQSHANSPTANIFSVQSSGATVDYFTVAFNGSSLFKSAANTALNVVYDATTAGQAAQFLLRDAGVDKWYVRKTGGNDFDVYGAVLGRPVALLKPSTP